MQGTATEAAAGPERARHARLPVLDAVRAASILLVLVSHLLPVDPFVEGANGAVGRAGMSLFFCLSGFLIARILLDEPPLGNFAVRRVMRIVPSMWLYLALVTLIYGLPVEKAVLSGLFVSNYATSGLSAGLTNHLWSLCVEMHFYIAVTVAVALGGVRALYALPIAALAVTAMRVDAGAWVSVNTHLRVDEILSGCCLALLSHHLAHRAEALLRSRGLAYGALGSVTVLWLLSCHEAFVPLAYLRPYLAGSVVGILLFARFETFEPIYRWAPVQYVAKVSYALYIYHPAMAYGPLTSDNLLVKYLVKRPITFLLTFAAAHFSTFYWERYWQQRARTWLSGRGRRSEA